MRTSRCRNVQRTGRGMGGRRCSGERGREGGEGVVRERGKGEV